MFFIIVTLIKELCPIKINMKKYYPFNYRAIYIINFNVKYYCFIPYIIILYIGENYEPLINFSKILIWESNYRVYILYSLKYIVLNIIL